MRYSRDESEFDRALAFIDASFAVPMTLLITTIEFDDRRSSFTNVSGLADDVGPQFIAFLISFAVIAGYWLMHHRMVRNFVALDTPTIAMNLVLVAAIVLLPFSSAAVGDAGLADLPLPTALMAVNIALVSALFTMVWVVARRNGLLDDAPIPGGWRWRVVNGLVPAAVFLASVPLAYLVSPGVARLSWFSLLVVNPAVGALVNRRRR